MSTESKMRIICDPYKKEIEYQWYDFNIENYVEFDYEYSKLSSEEYVHATIQNRAYEIVDLINKECNVGNVGLKINFVGTENDYDDFCKVIKNHYSDANIECVKDKHFFYAPDRIMPQIQNKFSDVKETLEKSTEEEIAKLVDQYNDAVKPSISLCVMGLYSAGKSAFINSIIGSEVLPSASNPTTARICKIYCDKEKYQIRFEFDGKECVLAFEGSAYKPNSNCDREIIGKLQKIIKTGTRHDEISHMNRALTILNEYTNDKHKIGDIIEIKIPFGRTSLDTKAFDFVIYDTPGSNSDSNIRHFEVLRDSLDKQTNALPIFLTTPDSMDAQDNDKILELIEETGAALDTTNAIVVVNKADEKGANALKEKQEKCQDSRITQWKSTRIFFLSSLIAIASKKDDPDKKEEWLDEDMFDLYEEKKSKYSSDGRKLFEYNIVDKSKANDNDVYSDDRKTTHLYKNSGLEAIEKEIIEYAHKYALYNKCQQASGYLEKAIDLCVENVRKDEKRLEATLEEAKGQFDSKKKNLCDNLGSKKEVIATYNTEFQELIEKDLNKFAGQNNLQQNSSNDMKKIQKELQELWDDLKTKEKKDKNDKGWTISQIQCIVNKKYNNYLNEFSQMVNKDIDSFWNEKSNQFKENCTKVVKDSDALTEEQKQTLKSFMTSKDNMSTSSMDFDLRKIGAIRSKHFLFWKLKSEKFDAKLCCGQLIQKFYDTVRKRISYVVSANEKNFRGWTDELINTLIGKLCEFNLELSSWNQKIEELKTDIISKKECKKMLIKSKEDIDELLNIQEGADNG